MTKLIIGILLFLILSSVAFYFFMIIYASHRIYILTLKRKDKEHWGRAPSDLNERTLKMDSEGMLWQAEHEKYKKDVHIINNGLNLYGEYYDIGSDKAVLILSGRTESLRYGYYFARPYSESGYNVLVIDPRGHGLSDGEFNTLGFEESKDAIAWVKFLNKEFGIEHIVFHGICIGAAGGILAITSPECPDCVKGIVTEGMFACFRESMKNHLIERKKLMSPILQCIDFWAKKYTGHSMKYGPINVISGMHKPILMIQSKVDKYSTVDNAVKMFEMCPSNEKKLVLYDIGDHSMLRLTDTEKYDTEISMFLQRLNSAKVNTAE